MISDPSTPMEARDTEDVLDSFGAERNLITRPLNLDERRAMLDLLGSERVVERFEYKGSPVHYPVAILTNELEIEDENQDMKPVNVSYRYAHRDTALDT